MDQQTIILDSSLDVNYFLDHDDAEIKRLERQHLTMKYILDRLNGPLPSGIYSNDINNVLDVAAGSLLWTLDLAGMPQVQERLKKDSNNPIHLYACDITAAKFPPPSITVPLGIKLFLHDVTKPFPSDLRGKFDLVNMKYLIMALSKTGWTKALNNIREILRPNGKLLLCEIDAFFYTKADVASQATRESHGLNPSKGSWIYPMNHIFRMNAIKNQHADDLSKSLPELALATSYEIVQKFSFIIPMGILCRSEPGAYGQSAAMAEETSTDNFEALVPVFTRAGLKDGYLEDENGVIINSEVEREMLCNRLIQNFRKEGIFLSSTELTIGRRSV